MLNVVDIDKFSSSIFYELDDASKKMNIYPTSFDYEVKLKHYISNKVSFFIYDSNGSGVGGGVSSITEIDGDNYLCKFSIENLKASSTYNFSLNYTTDDNRTMGIDYFKFTTLASKYIVADSISNSFEYSSTTMIRNIILNLNGAAIDQKLYFSIKQDGNEIANEEVFYDQSDTSILCDFRYYYLTQNTTYSYYLYYMYNDTVRVTIDTNTFTTSTSAFTPYNNNENRTVITDNTGLIYQNFFDGTNTFGDFNYYLYYYEESADNITDMVTFGTITPETDSSSGALNVNVSYAGLEKYTTAAGFKLVIYYTDADGLQNNIDIENFAKSEPLYSKIETTKTFSSLITNCTYNCDFNYIGQYDKEIWIRLEDSTGAEATNSLGTKISDYIGSLSLNDDGTYHIGEKISNLVPDTSYKLVLYYYGETSNKIYLDTESFTTLATPTYTRGTITPNSATKVTNGLQINFTYSDPNTDLSNVRFNIVTGDVNVSRVLTAEELASSSVIISDTNLDTYLADAVSIPLTILADSSYPTDLDGNSGNVLTDVQLYNDTVAISVS
jgi:hypothetical protein